MYPLCCIDIQNFLNQFYFFANDGFANTNVIDETLKNVGPNQYVQASCFLLGTDFTGSG